MNWGTFSATDLSAASLLSIAVLLVFLGGLIPRYVYNQMRADRDARLAESREEISDWKAAYQANEESRALQAQQLGELLELAKTMDAFIRSLQIASARRTDGSP